MSRLCAVVFLCALMPSSFAVAGTDNDERFYGSEQDSANERERERKSTSPYWNLWSSDFYGWLEELRAQAAYDTLIDLAKTYWAHFPIASYLGYDTITDEENHSETETSN